MTQFKNIPFLFVVIFITSFSSCKKDTTTPDPSTHPAHELYTNQKQQVKETYANIAFAVYDDSYQGAVNLKTAINAFVSNPTASGLLICQQKWRDVREVYGQSETFRFAEGPIDNAADGPEDFINAWPMDEVCLLIM